MKKQLIVLFLLFGYLYLLIKILVFKELALLRIGELKLNFGGAQERPSNLIPFKSILPYLLGEKGFLIAFLNLAGNIVALVPLGFIVPYLFRNTTWKKALVLAVVSGFIIEFAQFLLKIGIFDIDDVLLNGLGVIIGFRAYTFYLGFSKIIKKLLNGLFYTVFSSLLILYVISAYHLMHLPFGLEPSIIEQKKKAESTLGSNNNCCDLCNGTGGTGVIIALGKNNFNLKRKDGKKEIIRLTAKTIIKNSLGPATMSDLEVGDRVTVVIDKVETASLVLICGIVKKP